MKISPRELREAQIPSKAFGFNQDVVDALLERAADTIEGLIEENRQLFEALERLRNEGAQAASDPFAGVAQEEAPAPEPEPVPVAPAPVAETVAPAAPIDEIVSAQLAEKEELINKTLILAQRTADETLRTAKEQAEELVAQAQTDAETLVSNATNEAENLTGSAKEEAEQNVKVAQEQAQNMIAEAQGKADSLVAKAQAEADSIHEEERNKFVALVEQLSAERAQLISDIEILQGFDEEHRTKLRDAVQDDLSKLESRPTIDVSAIPELPKVEDIVPVAEVAPEPKKSKKAKEPEVVAHSEAEPVAHATFDDVFDASLSEDDAIDAIELDEDVLVSDDFEVDEIVEVPAAGDEPLTPEEAMDHDDPFSAFVDSGPIVEPAGNKDDSGVVAPAGSEVKSSDSGASFDPSRQAPQQEPLDDDDFFASLREAVQDDAPLGPSDDDSDGEGRFKGLFKK